MLDDLVTFNLPTNSISLFHKKPIGNSGLRQDFTGPTRAGSVIGPYPLTLIPQTPSQNQAPHPPPFLLHVMREVNRSERRHCEIGVVRQC